MALAIRNVRSYKQIKQLATGIIPAGALMLGLFFSLNASAATTAVDCADLPQAIVDASAGDTLSVTGDCTLTSGMVVNKQLTIQGDGDATISTSGTAQLFTVTADGTVIENLNFEKTDDAGSQVLIGVQADNVSLLNNTFSGQYKLGDNETSRAIVVSSVDGVTISGNTFTNLRQPAYINNNATGTVSGNYVDQTRGFVIEGATNITLTGNTWGNNAVDIAIIPGSPDATTNNYTCDVMAAIYRENNNPTIDNQLLEEPCPPVAPTNKDDCKNGGWATFSDLGFKNQGQCVSFVNHNDGNGADDAAVLKNR